MEKCIIIGRRAMLNWLLLPILCLLLLTSGCMKKVNSDMYWAEAKHSYFKGDHERAFRISEALAYEGNPEAQYALGYLFFYGIGTAENKALGIAWMEQSAQKGYAKALDAMDTLKNPSEA